MVSIMKMRLTTKYTHARFKNYDCILFGVLFYCVSVLVAVFRKNEKKRKHMKKQKRCDRKRDGAEGLTWTIQEIHGQM